MELESGLREFGMLELIDIIMGMLDEIENGRPISEVREDLLKVKGLLPGLIKNAGM